MRVSATFLTVEMMLFIKVKRRDNNPTASHFFVGWEDGISKTLAPSITELGVDWFLLEWKL